jgi:hypothetical protein
MKTILLVILMSISSIASCCPLKDSRICEIDNTLQAANSHHIVQYKEGSTSDPSIAAEYEMVAGAADIIHLGNTKDFSDDELFYLVAHEYGHSALKHTRKLLETVASKEDVSLPDASLILKYKDKIDSVPASFNHQQEFEADEFAIRLMIASGKDVLLVMKSVLKSNSSSQYHPAKSARLTKAKNIVTASK